MSLVKMLKIVLFFGNVKYFRRELKKIPHHGDIHLRTFFNKHSSHD